MKYLRIVLKTSGLLFWFIFTGMLALPGLFTGRRGIRSNAFVARLWAAGTARIIGLRITVDGNPGSFPGGVIVSNHQSYLDILAEGAVFPIRFSPKKEIKSWPVLGWFLALSRPVWVDRSSRQSSAEVAAEIVRTVNENISALIYPEGTTTDGRGGLLPFKSTPFEAVIQSGKPFLPVLLKYTAGGGGFDPAWYGDMTLLPHVGQMLAQKSIPVTMRILPALVPMPGEDRKSLAVRVHKIMEEEYRRMK